MDYNQKLIDKAKRSRCRICMEYISEADAAACEFQACKTSRGGVQLCTYPMLAARSEGGHMRTLLRYPGSKQRIAPWIISHMPKHHSYLEPYAGGIAVLLNKEPSRIETINDLDEDVANLFRVVRNKREELIEQIVYTPYARAEYDASFAGGGLMLRERRIS